MRRYILFIALVIGVHLSQANELVNADSIIQKHNSLLKSCKTSEQNGCLNDAISYATQDLELLYKYYGEDSEDVLRTLNLIGFLFIEGKDIKTAISIFSNIINISQKYLPKYENIYCDANMMYARLCYISGLYQECKDSALVFLRYIQEKDLDDKGKFVLGSLKLIGLCYYNEGEYLRAIEFFKLILNNSTSLETSIDALIWMARDYSKMGDNITALYWAEKAYKTIIDEKYSQTEPVTRLLMDISGYYVNLLNIEKATEFFNLAEINILKYRDKNHGLLDADFSLCKARLLLALNEIDSALDAAINAYTGFKQHALPSSPPIINSLNLLSVIYSKKNETKHAVKLAELSDSCYKVSHDRLDVTKSFLCYAYYQNKEYDKMLKCAYDFIMSNGERLCRMFTFTDDYARRMIWQNERGSLIYDLPLKIESINGSDNKKLLSKCLYDIALLKKGLLLSADTQFRRILSKKENKWILASIDSLRSLRYNTKDTSKYDKEIQELYSELRLSTQNNNALEQVLTTSWCDVQEKMSKNDVAIEFLLASDSTLIAVCLRKEWCEPKHVVLCKNAEILNLANNINETYNTTLIWDKIWKRIVEISSITPDDHVYFSPVDVLSQINIESVMMGQHLNISEKYNLIRVSSTKDICKHNIVDLRSLTCVFYGGLDYNVRIENEQGNNDTIFSLIIDSLRIERGKFDYLPGTKEEVDSAEKVVLKNGVLVQSIKKYQNHQGTEQTFRLLSGDAPKILHLATHSYYIKPSEEEVKNYKMRNREELVFLNNFNCLDMIDYGLERSGLLLSGAKNSLKQNNGTANDGILTAREISEIDLAGNDLVILSSCKSGLGAMTYDGVSGLQRGFKMAGAKTILMSLWNIDDNATSYMIINFYSELLRSGLIYQAYRYAQRKVREKYIDPYYWASFILLD